MAVSDDIGGKSSATGWDRVREDYEAGLVTINAVARSYGLSRGEIEQRARAGGWVRPATLALDRRILIHKLMALLERQIDVLEQAMNGPDRIESKMLSDLVRDLDRLITIEKAETGSTNPYEQSGEMSDLRRKLEARINAITKGRV
ncbi:hypothetical protein IC608_07645 [Devosia sp. PTR5]|uniref:Uncharacterized protein n=1 Tax=Devosia oryzisoli TaxID=2774138 RepID=A0A927ISD2_9HYPH|nr:hypothetical protein [Devosia oryzisoli]MBD8065344.1 hypothetical protein [Devosia oryzisoli]